ncbi:aspartate--tRNA ligase [Candidatus Nardonella dryophthoridicola]|uniref:aspartate--tRNA ligase n=1 Tax=Candidatus Nardonella dryophthoridicola TaxID=1971485 RepID=UPI001AD89494|nr:aspartate--tRNA ligase [Candidatus Nardonella dryophthoridicola]QTJ62901.1 aspartate--tRNA ligase [Candidatus Nardonella dryophthoridicola]
MKKNIINNIKNLNLYINKKIKIKGWINNINFFKKSNIIFINLKDNYGNIQIVITNNFFDKKKINTIKKYKIYYLLEIIGIVKNKKIKKPNSNENEYEIIACNIFLINKSKKLPININKNFSDINKIKYRYLYFRQNKNLFNNILKRSELLFLINKFMNKNEFINIETPIISKNISEGSKNFNIISNTYKKYKKYSLSQSPQIFKQLLIISGFNKYYQISKCFRDEDIRSNRQPEFTQLDIESSIVDNNFILKISEKLIKYIWNKINNVKINNFKYIKYKDSIRMYGTDKPNINNYLTLYNIKDDIYNKINEEENLFFINILNNHCCYIKNKIKKIIKYNFIKFEDLLNIIIKKIKNNYTNIEKKEILNKLNKIKNNKINSDIYFITKDKNIIYYINELRNIIWENTNINNNDINPIWVLNFPMFEINKEKLKCVNHPFTMPIIKKEDIENNIIKNPLNIYSKSYDLVINGIEIASGTERINDHKLQKIIFNTLKININKQKKEFGFFLESLKYGTPKHNGIAFGLDRIMMLLTNEKDIKNVIAFPKTNNLLDITNI